MAVQCNNRLVGATIVLSVGCPNSVPVGVYGMFLSINASI